MTQPVTTLLPLVFVNGEQAEVHWPSLSARDRGFTLADGLFETMLVRRGVVFRLDQHLARLSGGLRRLSIPEPAGLSEWIQQALVHVGPANVSLRLTVTRGIGAGGLTPPFDPRPTTVITIGPLPAVAPTVYADGLRATIASGRRNPQAMTVGLKTLSYTDAVLALMDAQRAGADEALFLDIDDHCSEATASNLFVYRQGELLTPPVSCAALPGITRAAALDLAASLGIAAAERAFGLEQLLSADEAFLTSSLRGIAPLTMVNGNPIGSGAVGYITTQLRAAYGALVERECDGA